MDGSLENKDNSFEPADKEEQDINLKIEQTDIVCGKSEAQTETDANAKEINSNENEKTPTNNSDNNEDDISVEAPTKEEASDEIHINSDEELQKASEKDDSRDSEKVEDKPDVTDVFGSGELVKEVTLAFLVLRIMQQRIKLSVRTYLPLLVLINYIFHTHRHCQKVKEFTLDQILEKSVHSM